MSDLIERLRDRSGFVERGPMALMQHCEEAAAELERLTAENARYRSAIRWALGYDEGEPQFRGREDGDKPYYWRAELQRRAGDSVRDAALDSARAKESGDG